MINRLTILKNLFRKYEKLTKSTQTYNIRKRQTLQIQNAAS